MQIRLKALLALAVCAGAAAGCSKPVSPGGAGQPAPPLSAPLAAKSDVAAAHSDAAPFNPGLPQLAYSYEAEIRAAPETIPALLARQEGACQHAGPLLCQVIRSALTSDRNAAHAELKLRAQPQWLRTFRDGLAADARASGGGLVSTSTRTEDLTRQIVDTDAALRAKTTLAERLQGLLAERQGKLSDLLDVEKALAETQGEIDTARSELTIMRGRVATDDLTLTYTSSAAFASAWKPVGEAAKGAMAVFAQGVAALILLTAGLLPFGAIAAIGLTIWRALARRRRTAALTTAPT